MIHLVELTVFGCCCVVAVRVRGLPVEAGATMTTWTNGSGWAQVWWVTWFLVGGDLYTPIRSSRPGAVVRPPARSASTHCLHRGALPAGVPAGYCGRGRSPGCTAYVTPADFVQGRYGSSLLATLVAGDRDRGHHALHRAAAGRPGGVLRTMGLNASGIGGTCRCSSRSSSWRSHLQSGLRAPALIAVRQGHPDLPSHPGSG